MEIEPAPVASDISGELLLELNQKEVEGMQQTSTLNCSVSSPVLTGARSCAKENGISLLHALNKKYSSSSLSDLHCTIFMTPSSPGRSNSGTLKVPQALSLDCQGIANIGDIAEISNLCSKVTELDLAKNNLCYWKDVFDLLDVLPSLEFLNLSSNPLVQLKTYEGNHQFPKLKKLVLNFTNISFETLNYVLQVFPCLEELYLSHNQLENTGGLSVKEYSSLTFLQLTSNNFSDWCQLCKLGLVFNKLSFLIMADNPIASFGDLELLKASFKNLTILNLNQTAISDWNELENLKYFPALYDARIVGIPLAKTIEDVQLRRQLLVSMIPQIQCLNGGQLLSSERETSERVFLRHFQQADVKPKRYVELGAKHGELPKLASVDYSKKETTAAIKVVVVDEPIEETVKVNLDMTVGEFKRIARRIACAGSNDSIKIRYEEVGTSYPDTELLLNSTRLYRYSMKDGDKIHVIVYRNKRFPAKSKPSKASIKSQS